MMFVANLFSAASSWVKLFSGVFEVVSDCFGTVKEHGKPCEECKHPDPMHNFDDPGEHYCTIKGCNCGYHTGR